MTEVLFECAECHYQSSVTAGTIFDRSRIPLTVWFRVIWWITSQKTGASALGLKRILGFGSYETAWTCLHKLRRAMVRSGRDRLAGIIEVDETYIGGENLESGDVAQRERHWLSLRHKEMGNGTAASVFAKFKMHPAQI